MIHQIVARYGAYFNTKGERNVDHTFLTSIVDQAGELRVQYMGWRFDPDEFTGDLRSLVHEGEAS
jgi:protein SCO1/2